MPIAQPTGAWVVTDAWETGSPGGYYIAIVPLSLVAPPQVSEYRDKNDIEDHRGFKLTDLLFQLADYGSAPAKEETAWCSIEGGGISASIEQDIATSLAPTWYSADDVDGHFDGAIFKASGYGKEAPDVAKMSMRIYFETEGGWIPQCTALAFTTDVDVESNPASFSYEQGACHTVSPTADDWVPFAAGESCSTYEMSQLLCVNTNRVNYLTRPDRSVIVCYARKAAS